MRRISFAWSTWLNLLARRFASQGFSGREWSDRAGTSEPTLRRALRDDPAIAFTTIESLLVAGRIRFFFWKPGDAGEMVAIRLPIEQPLRYAARLLVGVADDEGIPNSRWADNAGVSEATVRRLRKGDPKIGIEVFARLLGSAGCRISRRFTRPLVVVIHD